jgi:hypothetical protein
MEAQVDAFEPNLPALLFLGGAASGIMGSNAR